MPYFLHFNLDRDLPTSLWTSSPTSSTTHPSSRRPLHQQWSEEPERSLHLFHWLSLLAICSYFSKVPQGISLRFRFLMIPSIWFGQKLPFRRGAPGAQWLDLSLAEAAHRATLLHNSPPPWPIYPILLPTFCHSWIKTILLRQYETMV